MTQLDMLAVNDLVREIAKALVDEPDAVEVETITREENTVLRLRVAPQDVGKRVAEHFVTSPHQYTKTIHYSEIASWYGALRFAYLTHDDALRDELIKKFEPLMPGGAEAERRPVRRQGGRSRSQRAQPH